MTAARETGVLVAEDNDDLRGAVCALIEAEPDIGTSASGGLGARLLAARAGTAAGARARPDLRGESSVDRMRVEPYAAATGVVVYSGHDRRASPQAVQRNSPCVFVTKTSDVTELLDAIRRRGNGTGRRQLSPAPAAGIALARPHRARRQLRAVPRRTRFTTTSRTTAPASDTPSAARLKAPC